MLNRSYPILFRSIFFIALPMSLLLIAAYLYFMQSLPQKEGVIQLRGLKSQVEIIRDSKAIPHIFANSDEDAFFAIGYVHAQDRMWQMEYQRRLGQGRLSEVFGNDTLETDQFVRTLGIYRAAKTALDSLDIPARQSLDAYVNGVNAWISEKHVLPPEYHIFDFEPEKWKPEDSLVLIKLLALTLGGNYPKELTLDLLINEVGLERASLLIPDYPSDGITVTQATGGIDDESRQNLLVLNEHLNAEFNLGGEALGSNGWVVSGEHTKSGKPLLANDPHLGTEIPSVWYLAELQGDRLHVIGATIPGLPYVVLGHNESIAWGGTSLGADVQDLYLERTNRLNQNQYEVDGEWVDMDIYEEEIIVKSSFPSFLTDAIPPLKWEIRRTRNGPLISDVKDQLERPIALKWTALEKDDKTFESFLELNYARDWTEFKLALENYLAPSLNFLYADTKGNIGYISAGKVPIRQKGDGKLPVPGWDSDYQWKDSIPFESMPQSFNPEMGVIVSANNKNHSQDYPYLISNNWAPPYRAERINEVIHDYINVGTKLEVQDFARLQGDNKSLQAVELLKFIRKLKPRTQLQENAINKLSNWDGVMTEESDVAALYQSWFRHFSRAILNDELRGDLQHVDRLDRLLKFAESLNPVFVSQVVKQTSSSGQYNWCDHIYTKQEESCEISALNALDEAIEELFSLTGKKKKWGDVHSTFYPHKAISNIQLLDRIFDREISNSGAGYTINVAGWTYSKEDGYRQDVNPSYRQVIDLSDWNLSGFINSTGQSGNVLSKNYDDNIKRHKELVLLPMTFANKDVLNEDELLKIQPVSVSIQKH